MLDLTGFEDRGDHQEPKRLHGQISSAPTRPRQRTAGRISSAIRVRL
jgi:hypothetical protein